MFNLKTNNNSTEKFNFNFFFKIRLEFKFQEHSYREVSIQEQTRIIISRTSWKFFFSRTVWKFLFQEHTRILFHEQSVIMFKNRQDLFQEKSRRFHFKNNWKFNFMKKNGIIILTTGWYFVEEQTGGFDFIPRSGLIKQLAWIKFSPISPLTYNPTVKGYVNPEN